MITIHQLLVTEAPHKLPALAKKCAPSTAPVVLKKAHSMMIHRLPAPEAHLLHHQTSPSCIFPQLFRNWELPDNVLLYHRHRSILMSRRYKAICTSSAQNFTWFFDTASEMIWQSSIGRFNESENLAKYGYKLDMKIT